MPPSRGSPSVEKYRPLRFLLPFFYYYIDFLSYPPTTMSPAKIVYPSPRVSQLDASILDDELFSLLKQQLSDAFQLISTKSWSFNLHPDLWSLALKLVVFKLTTFNTGSSYGFKLQNLKLSDKNSGSVIGNRTRYLLLATILGEFVFKKVQSYLFNLDVVHSQSKNLFGRLKTLLLRYKSDILKISGDTIHVLQMLNFVSFLIFGRYPNLVYRALGISVTPIVADLLKFNGSKVNFEFQNRQLVWNVMTEFLVFILPLLQLRKLRRVVRGLIPKRKDDEQHYGFSDKPVTTRFTSLPISQCAMCIETTEARGIKAASTQITNPCVINCNHVYCYICLATRFNAIENGNEQAEGCPRCRMKITSFKQYGDSPGQVDQDAIMIDYDDVESEEDDTDEDNGLDNEYHDTLPEKSLSSDNELDEEEPLYSEEFKESAHQSDYSGNEDLEEEDEFSEDYDSVDDDDGSMDEALM